MNINVDLSERVRCCCFRLTAQMKTTLTLFSACLTISSLNVLSLTCLKFVDQYFFICI